MGTEAAWVPLVLSAIGTGATAYTAHQTAKEQDRAAAQGIRQQAERQRQADERVSQEVNALEQSSPEAARQQATDAFMSQLRRTRQQAVTGGPVGASDRYQTDMEQAGADVQDFGGKVAKTLARINAPTLQRIGEGQQFARLSSNLNQIGRFASGDDFLNQLRMRGIRANPWVQAGGQILTGVAGGMASSGYGQSKYGVNDPRATRRVDVPVGTPPYAGGKVYA